MRIRGLELEVRDSRPGGASGSPAFIWGHGLLGSLRQEDEARLLAWPGLEERARLIRYDARGHGRSEATLDPDDYRWPELAADLWALADALEVDRAVLGGVSMGAATALHAAVSSPDRVRGLVLMAPPTAWATRPRQSRIYRTSATLIDRVGLWPFRCLGAAASLVVTNKGLAGMQRSVMTGLRRADPRAVVAAMRGAALSDLPDPDRLDGLDVPTLILAWKGDPTHPLSTAEALAERIEGSELHQAGSLDEMRSWQSVLEDFLSRIEER